jgi:phosphoglycolate phosphatase
MTDKTGKYDAIIFDIDGTLFDSADLCTKSWNLALESMGAKITISKDNMKKSLGLNTEEIIAKLIPKEFNNIPNLNILLDKYEITTLEKDGCQLYPNVMKVIKKLAHNHKIGIISNCQEKYLSQFLKHSGLSDYITDNDCYGRAKNTKTEMIKKMSKKNNWKKYVYVGDTEKDYHACQNARCDFIHANYGYGKIKHAITKIKNIKDIYNFV